MVTLAILKKQQRLSVPALQAQMPDTIHILSDPLLLEEELHPLQLNDATAIWARIKYFVDLEETSFSGKCQVSRQSRPYMEAGAAPADDANDIWDVVIPGGVPDVVRVANVAVIENDDEELRRVYTIIHIGQDRLSYIARLTMEDYGLRRP